MKFIWWTYLTCIARRFPAGSVSAPDKKHPTGTHNKLIEPFRGESERKMIISHRNRLKSMKWFEQSSTITMSSVNISTPRLPWNDIKQMISFTIWQLMKWSLSVHSVHQSFVANSLSQEICSADNVYSLSSMFRPSPPCIAGMIIVGNPAVIP